MTKIRCAHRAAIVIRTRYSRKCSSVGIRPMTGRRLRQQVTKAGNRKPELLRSGSKVSWASFMGRPPALNSKLGTHIFAVAPRFPPAYEDFRRACSHSFLPPLFEANCPQLAFPFPANPLATRGSRRSCVCQILHVVGVHLALTPSFQFCGALVLKVFRRPPLLAHA